MASNRLPQALAASAMTSAESEQAFINVEVSDGDRERIEREQAFWSGPRLVLLLFGTLAIAIPVLYLMASV